MREEKIADEMRHIISVLPDTEALEWNRSHFTRCRLPGGARVVALGEAVHGSSTLFSFKNAMVRYLVEEQGFRLICYEFSFEQSLDIDRYVNGDPIDIDSLLGIQSWIQANQQTRDLIYWLRDFNDNLPVGERAHFVGVDCQTDMFFPYRLRHHFARLNPEFGKEMNEFLTRLEAFDKPVYQGMDKEHYNAIESALSSLESGAESYFNRINDDTASCKGKAAIIQLIRCAERSHRFLYSVSNGGLNLRDKYMKDNILWAMDNISGNERAIFWAHNAHVRADPDYYGEGQPSAGMMLKALFGDDYLVIGTAFNRGIFTAVEADPASGKDTPPHLVVVDTMPLPGSLNDLFRQMDEKSFLVDFRKLKSSALLSDFLRKDIPFLGVGDFFTGSLNDHYRFYHGPVQGEFDIIFFFDSIAPLTLL